MLKIPDLKPFLTSYLVYIVVIRQRYCEPGKDKAFVYGTEQVNQGCARFGEFWLFLTEQVFTLPL